MVPSWNVVAGRLSTTLPLASTCTTLSGVGRSRVEAAAAAASTVTRCGKRRRIGARASWSSTRSIEIAAEQHDGSEPDGDDREGRQQHEAGDQPTAQRPRRTSRWLSTDAHGPQRGRRREYPTPRSVWINGGSIRSTFLRR